MEPYTKEDHATAQARFARSRAELRAKLVTKIQTAFSQLGWDEETIAQTKRAIGQCESLSKNANPPADIHQLEAILEHLRLHGFKDTYKRADGKQSQPLSQEAQAKLLRGLWLEMHTLGAVKSPDESSLCKWAINSREGAVKSDSVTTSLSLMPSLQLDQAIERLKKWRERWMMSGKLVCPQCQRSFQPTPRQVRAFGKIACDAHKTPVAYLFIPPKQGRQQ